MTAAMREAWEDGQRNVAWADAHAVDLEQYAGQWLCIAEGRLVVVERDARTFGERVRAGQWHRPGRVPHIFRMPTREEMAAVHPFLHALEPRSE